MEVTTAHKHFSRGSSLGVDYTCKVYTLSMLKCSERSLPLLVSRPGSAFLVCNCCCFSSPDYFGESFTVDYHMFELEDKRVSDIKEDRDREWLKRNWAVL